MKKLNVIFSSIFWMLIFLYPSTVNSIDCANKNYGDEDKDTILNIIRSSLPEEVNSFDLSGNHFGITPGEYADDPSDITNGEALSDILSSLTRFKNIETLKLSENYLIQDETLKSLNRLLGNLKKIKTLDLRKTSLLSDNLNIITDNISSFQHLESLNISENFIYSEGAVQIAEVILKLKNLKEIDLSFCALCYCDDREKCDEDLISNLKYDPTYFLQLAENISQHENINKVKISYYSGARIKKEDLKKFKEIIVGKEIIS